MKVLKETLLLNDLVSALDEANEEEILIMRQEKEPIVLMCLEKYNELKAQLYKKEK